MLEDAIRNDSTKFEDIEDAPIESHIPKPPQTQMWIRVFFSFFICVFASGPLQAYPTIQQKFLTFGVFDEGCGDAKFGRCTSQNDKLSLLYYASTGSSVSLMLFTGQMYDVLGARLSAIVGAVGVVLGSFFIFLALYFKSMEPLLWFALPLADTSGFLNSFALLGFLWHLEEHQGVISGLVNACSQTSAIMIYVVVLSEKYIPLPFTFLIVGGFAWLAGLMSAFLLPTQEQFYDQQERVFGFRSKPPSFAPFHGIRDVFNVFSFYKKESFLLIISSLLAYLFVVNWVGGISSYLEIPFSKNKAADLSNYYTIIATAIGSFAAPFSGFLFDKMKIKKFSFLLVFLEAMLLFTVFVKNFYVVLFTFVIATWYFCAWQTFLIKFAAMYAPPELLGSYFAVIFALCGAVQFGLNFLLPSILKRFFSEENYYFVQWAGFGSVSVVAFLIFALFLLKIKIPKLPPQCTSSNKPLCGNDFDVDETKPLIN